ncbi:MAG: FecR family protein [Novosphingobium sp.]
MLALRGVVTMRDRPTHADAQAQIDDTAIEWVIRKGAGTFEAGEQDDLDAWLAADTRHAAAFRHAERTWTGLDVLAHNPGRLRDDLPTASLSNTRRFTRPSPFVFRPAAITACAVLTICGGTFWFGDPLTAMRSDYRTGIGEIRMVTLEDGSTVKLGPDTAIATHFDGRERRVELLRGVAAFTAVPKARANNLPFVVTAANGEARALGTRFVVDRLPGAVDVTVEEHKVRVSIENHTALHSATVATPGQRVRYDANEVSDPIATDLALATGWQRGRLIVDAVPLEIAIAQFNRYRRGRIVLAHTAMAQRKVSGVFDTRDIDGAIATIAGELGLRTVRIGPLATILY